MCQAQSKCGKLFSEVKYALAENLRKVSTTWNYERRSQERILHLCTSALLAFIPELWGIISLAKLNLIRVCKVAVFAENSLNWIFVWFIQSQKCTACVLILKLKYANIAPEIVHGPFKVKHQQSIASGERYESNSPAKTWKRSYPHSNKSKQ